MPFVVIKQGGNFRVKNTTTGKIGKDKFKKKENADIQVKNRQRFIKLIQQKTGDKKKVKKKKK